MQPRQNSGGDNSMAIGDSMPVVTCDRVERHVGNAGTESGVWSTLIVVSYPLPQHEPKTPFIQRDQPIQARSPDRADQPLAERIRLRASHRRLPAPSAPSPSPRHRQVGELVLGFLGVSGHLLQRSGDRRGEALADFLGRQTGRRVGVEAEIVLTLPGDEFRPAPLAECYGQP
jgi:hypothetical protein